MKKFLLLITVLIAAVLLAACGGEQPAASTGQQVNVADMVGVWQQGTTDFHMRLNADGTFQTGVSVEGLDSDPVDFGRYTLEGDLLTLTSDAAAPVCPGMSGQYTVTIVSMDEVRMKRVSEACEARTVDPIPPYYRVK